MKEICIKENIIDFHALENFSKDVLSKSPLSFKFTYIEDEYIDNCLFIDFDLINGEYKFNKDKYNSRKANYSLKEKILELKKLLKKYKEDIEQVELFEMERIDYEDKKKQCAQIIIELRELEKS